MKCNVRKNSNDDAQSSHVRREGGRGRKRGGGRGREGLGGEGERDWEGEREGEFNKLNWN